MELSSRRQARLAEMARGGLGSNTLPDQGEEKGKNGSPENVEFKTQEPLL